MILGIGTDLAKTSLFKTELKKEISPFLASVFTKSELEQNSSFVPQEERLAGKFAAKESFIKAMGLIVPKGTFSLVLTEIEVKTGSGGQPFFLLSGNSKKALDLQGKTKIWLSISHETDYAIAMVIIEKTGI
jgi:holo-[acyl-carrier protein] synthase